MFTEYYMFKSVLAIIMSSVIAVRVPRKLKEELDKLGINYADEIRKFLRERVKREKMKRLLHEIRILRKKSPKIEGNLAAKFVREDRESR